MKESLELEKRLIEKKTCLKRHLFVASRVYVVTFPRFRSSYELDKMIVLGKFS